jgi:hypothetical protein
MIENYICIEQRKRIGSIVYDDVILELERFADRIEIEMSNSDDHNVHIRINIEQAKKLAEFIGGFVGMVSA